MIRNVYIYAQKQKSDGNCGSAKHDFLSTSGDDGAKKSKIESEIDLEDSPPSTKIKKRRERNEIKLTTAQKRAAEYEVAAAALHERMIQEAKIVSARKAVIDAGGDL